MDPLPDRPQPARPLGEAVHAWVQWFGLARLVVTALAVLGVGAGGYWLLRSPATGVESTLPYAAPSSPTVRTTVASVPSGSSRESLPPTSNSVAPSSIVVYVAGAVVAPGVYRIAADARVQQAIALAGGPAADADVDVMNLAALMHDGDRVYVPHSGLPVPVVIGQSGGVGAGSTQSSSQPASPVDLNRATAEQLDALPGIGPATAAAIVTHRELKGPFSSVDGLLDVPGIGPAKLDAIRALVSV